ncbi:MAG: GTPase [Planctomycetes bacterium]|nr:GTPase [Planctomycetota bacterium]
MAKKVLIMGAAGRDFHVFNTCYRGRSDVQVVAFTATQIPHIEDRRYPAALAGPGYPQGIPIRPEEELVDLIRKLGVEEVVFAYSDVANAYFEERRRRVEAAGASFKAFDVDASMIRSKKPVIAVCAVRTGCGKSQTSRRVVSILREQGLRTIVIRHPMPYGDLERQKVQRFATIADLAKHECTIEEMEEYEPHIAAGAIVYAGVDYQAILDSAEKEADVILWDGGNNDTPFYKPDLWITVADPHRPGHELGYFPGRVNFERCDLLLINKVDTATPAGIAEIEKNARELNPKATVVLAESPVRVPDPNAIRGKRVLAVEDGPTLTHGEMQFGAATVAARKWGAASLVDPRPYLVGELADTFKKYPKIGALLPAMGYGTQQVHDLEATLAKVDCDLVLIGTPIDLARIVKIKKPSQRVTYDSVERGAAFRERVLAVVNKRRGAVGV